jgi:hypothetical protein
MAMPADSLSVKASPIARGADNLAIDSPKLQRLYQDWLGRRRGRPLPARRDFDILDLQYILGDLSLLDVLVEPLRFRFCVHGSNAADRLRVDLTGKSLDDHPDPEHREFATWCCAEAVATRTPQRLLRDRLHFRLRVLRWEGLVLPLSADGRSVDTLMVGSDLL